ncbi:hypothetical protein JV16_01618 [Anoxybacillus ayderensis]|uniref:Uncharacterized protein n=1 Tax=Anoxybacillus ayderensis TaxID=265546 RepID=A0A0D0HLT7_9BACL|nr:hypothetical protein [Anoxybacillus ayderensis]KIP21124.1 hypothetical protein JV16_01618 [Anoxybacillus ayderensis]
MAKQYQVEFFNDNNQLLGKLTHSAQNIDEAVQEVTMMINKQFSIVTMEYGKDIELRNVILTPKISRFTVVSI